MTNRMQNIRLGFFLVLGVAAVVLLIFLVGAQEGLFRRTFNVSTYFDVVQGIRSGSAVRLSGIDIGVVDKVDVSPANNRVRLDLKLYTRVKGFIKKDSYATMEAEGLVGNYFISLTVGSAEAEEVKDGDVIQSKEPVRLTVILEDAQSIMKNIRVAADELSKTLAAVNQGQGTLGKLVTSDEVYRSLQSTTARIDTGVGEALGEITGMAHMMSGLAKTITDVVLKSDSVITAVNSVVSKLDRGEGTIGALLSERAMYDSLLLVVQNAIIMTEDAKAGASKFSENMEALKHNFLFKGYFEDRGYWDKADYEAAIDRKIAQLKQLERDVARQSEQLRLQEEQLRKHENQMRDRQTDQP